MLTLKGLYCGVKAEETELQPGGEAHLKRDLLDGSFAAGVAH